MISALAIATCLLSALEITVSPDQPLAYSYIDDPLIVEVRSDLACVADITVTLDTGAAGGVIERAFPETSLGPDINRWCAVKDLPKLRGPWAITVQVAANAETEILTATVYRIDRPAGAYAHPVYVYGDAIDRDTLLALRSVAVNQVRIPSTHPDIGALLDTMVELNMQAIVAFEHLEGAEDAAARLGEAYCAAIARWELVSPGDAPALRAAVEKIQALPCSLPVSIGLRDTEDASAIMAALAPGLPQHYVVHQWGGDAGKLEGIRDAMAAYGMESPMLDYLYRPDATPEAGDELLQRYFDALANRTYRVAIPAEWIMKDGELQPGLADLNGLAHGVAPAPAYGDVPQKRVRAILFARGDAWALPFWSSGGIAALALDLDENHPVRLFDRWNNPLELPAPEGGILDIPALGAVRVAHGAGGEVLQEGLLYEARAMAAGILKRKELSGAWSAATREALADIDKSPESESSRVRFFTLLRAFPELEERWHSGQLPRPVAVSALSHLAGLSRLLCRLEAARGATFLEPLQDTLARCEEYQSLYLTGTTTTPQARARGDWLVQEVRRLMDEVESLVSDGSKVEADAVAALAEWRARGLEFAAKAGPMSDQMALPEPEPAPEPEPKPVAPTSKKKGKKK